MGWGVAIAALASAGAAAYSADQQKKAADKTAALTEKGYVPYNPVTGRDVTNWLGTYNKIYQRQADQALKAGQTQLETYAPGTTQQLKTDLTFFRDPTADQAVQNALARAGLQYAVRSGAGANPMDAFARNYGLNVYDMRRRGVFDSNQAISQYQGLIPRGILPDVETAYQGANATKNALYQDALNRRQVGITAGQQRIGGQLAQQQGYAQAIGSLIGGIGDAYGAYSAASQPAAYNPYGYVPREQRVGTGTSGSNAGI